MNEMGKRLCLIAVCLGVSSGVKAQDAVPDVPFKTVHLMIVTPIQESFLAAAVKDFNKTFAEQGCPSCAYRIFRMIVGKPNKYNYMMTADWPSSNVYLKIHASAAFAADSKRNPVLDDLSKQEFYGRYAEVR